MNYNVAYGIFDKKTISLFTFPNILPLFCFTFNGLNLCTNRVNFDLTYIVFLFHIQVGIESTIFHHEIIFHLRKVFERIFKAFFRTVINVSCASYTMRSFRDMPLPLFRGGQFYVRSPR